MPPNMMKAPTGKLDPVGAFIMFGGIYYGAMYGSSTTSILLNTPGENSSVVTAIEGHQMAKNGRGAAALATAAIGSFVAGTLATFALALFAPVVVTFALQFGPADYFALMLLAFTTVTAVLGSSMLRGLVSLLFGLAIGLVEALEFKGKCLSALVQMLGTRSVSERLAMLLCTLAEIHGVPEADGVAIGPPFTHEAFARMVGASRQWVTMTLDRFQGEGKIRIGKRRTVIRHPERLLSMSA